MEKQSFIQKNQFIILAIAIFLALNFIYFSPVLEGKTIQQDDVENIKDGFSEIREYKKETGRYALWSNAMFSGMPTYLMWLGYPANVAGHILDTYSSILPNPIGTVFLYLLGFFILLRSMGMNVWLSILGSIAFAFSSYNFIIISAGHTNKAIVIGLFAPTIAGVLMAYRGKYLVGGVLTALALAMQIRANHYQMSYYLALGILIYVIVELIYSFKEKTISNYIKASVAMIAAVIIAVGINLTPLMLIEEYSHYTIRGKSELTLSEDINKDGLSKDYAFEYSYGVNESLSFLIPNVLGGSSAGELTKESETFKYLQKGGVPNATQIIKQLPLYWGEQAFTAGPVYFGAIVMFLFIFGLFLVKGRYKWWIFATFILTVMLSWGKHFESLSFLFFDYVPMYNKFRAVSSILTVTSLLIPLLAALAIKEMLDEKVSKNETFKALRNSFIITGGLTFILAVMPSLVGSFVNEAKDQQVFGQAYKQIIDSIAQDRSNMLRSDAFRSFFFIFLAAALIFAYIKNKVKANVLVIAIAALILVDMWSVDKRYLNNDKFVKKSKKVEVEAVPDAIDQQILQDKDLYYRVYNLTVNPFTDASTSKFHKSIGGYHAAKMKRYQELIEYHISKGNMSVLNMLNTKYLIGQDQQSGQKLIQLNEQACGNAWYVSEIKYVANADSEITALTNFNAKTTAIVDERFKESLTGLNVLADSSANIRLTRYSPDTLSYESNASAEGFVVFSDIYYEKGWNAYVDGEKMPHVRVNYVLRGMKVSAGKHAIEFRFEPEKYYLGEKVSLASSVILVLLVLLALWKQFKK
jgi:hypothetical protein